MLHTLQDSFADVGASEEVMRALAAMGIQRPSYIQAAAYRALRGSDGHVVLADHAGTCFPAPALAPAHSAWHGLEGMLPVASAACPKRMRRCASR
jgi:ATP-dependent RNA helicase DDX18/HAS1